MNSMHASFLVQWLHSPRRSGAGKNERPMLRTPAVRGFLFVWISLVYFWGIWDLLGAQFLNPASSKCWAFLSQFGMTQLADCPPLQVLVPQQLDFEPILVFTGLILVYGLLLWRSLEGSAWGWRRWLSLLVQAGAIFAAGLVVHQTNVALSLSLSLTLAVISTSSRNTLFAIGVAGGALGLFALTLFLEKRPGESWELFLLSIVASTDMTAIGLFLAGYCLLYVHQSRAHTELTGAHLQLQAAASRIEALTRLTERRRLARELHDTLAQGLVGLTLQLETADGLLTWERPGQAQEIIQQALARARATLTEARDAIDDLRAEQADTHVFLEAVQTEIHHLTSASGLCCHTDLEALRTLDPLHQEHVLRSIAEGVTNVVRHAHAHHIWVRFIQDGEMQTIEVGDDGRGFDPDKEAERPGHYGLIGLRERAQLLGGCLNIVSTARKGTTIRFSFPQHSGGSADESNTKSTGRAAIDPCSGGR